MIILIYALYQATDASELAPFATQIIINLPQLLSARDASHTSFLSSDHPIIQQEYVRHRTD
jgi:hypothetical protein